MKQEFFYCRVSSKEQNETRQLEVAKELKIKGPDRTENWSDQSPH